MKNIGVYAGTFDPIHDGHLAFAEAAISSGLDKVYFLTEPRPWRKQGVKALEHRQEMVNLAIKSNDRFGAILYKGSRLTPHESLPVLQKRFTGSKLSLLFGDDVISHMVKNIADWPNIEKLVDVELVIGARHHNQLELSKEIDRLRKDHALPFSYKFVNPNHHTTTSSKIRADLRNKVRPQGLPEGVLNYVLSKGIYHDVD